MNIESVQSHDRLDNKYVNNSTKEQYQTSVQHEVSAQQQDTFERSEVSAPKNKSNDKIKKALIIAAAITAAVAIICAIKGKSRQAKDLANKASSTASVTKTGTQAAEEVVQNASRATELTLDAFKEQGNSFKKGVAKLKDGQNYTGTILHTDKSGNKFAIEYMDGLLSKSTKKGVDAADDFVKTYTKNQSGKEILLTKKAGAFKTVFQDDKIIKFENGKQVSEISISKLKEDKAESIARAAEEAQKKAAEEAQRQAAEEAQKKAEEEAQKQAQKAATTGIKLKTQEEFDKMSPEELGKYHADILRGFDEPENADRIGPLRRELAKIQLKEMEVRRIETFESLKGKIPDKTTVKLRTKTGEEVEATITLRGGLDGSDYGRSAKVNSQVEGRADIMVHKKGEVSFFAGIPKEYYKEGAFEVHLLGTSPDYKGCGTKLMQQIVQDSQNAGCGGRVFLDACNSDLPSDYYYLCMGKNGSPVPFYYKLGFRFQDPMRNECAEKGIEKMAKTGKYCGISDGIMYLPEENIAALLAK